MIGRGLYAILDLERLAGRDLGPLAAALLRGGAVAIQVRCKRLGAAALLAAARELGPLCRGAGRPLVVNDRPDVARLCGADLVHLGQEDLGVDEARSVWPGARVGVSTHSPQELEAALAHSPEYVGYGPVYGTTTKERPDPVQGIDGLARAVGLAGTVPVVAIGGIDSSRAAAVAATGAWAAAAIAAVDFAEDPEALARTFAAAFEGRP